MASTGGAMSHGELEQRSNRLAHLLRAEGLQRPDHYAVFREDNHRLFEACMAGERSGLYCPCINSHLTADELAYVVNNSESPGHLNCHDWAASGRLQRLHPRCVTIFSITGHVTGPSPVSVCTSAVRLGASTVQSNSNDSNEIRCACRLPDSAAFTRCFALDDVSEPLLEAVGRAEPLLGALS